MCVLLKEESASRDIYPGLLTSFLFVVVVYSATWWMFCKGTGSAPDKVWNPLHTPFWHLTISVNFQNRQSDDIHTLFTQWLVSSVELRKFELFFHSWHNYFCHSECTTNAFQGGLCLLVHHYLHTYTIIALLYDGRLFTPPSSVAVQNN